MMATEGQGEVKIIERARRGQATVFIVSAVSNGKVWGVRDFYAERSRKQAEEYAAWLRHLLELERNARG
jgi:hypothetical protein